MCLFYTKLDYAASGGELNPKKRIKQRAIKKLQEL